MANSKQKQKPEQYKPYEPEPAVPFGSHLEAREYAGMRKKRIQDLENEGRKYGRELGQKRQKAADYEGGLYTPMTYLERAGQYIGDKATDVDAYLSEKLGMAERAATRRGERMGLKEEGYKKGGKVSSASKRADGCAQRGKTKGRII